MLALARVLQACLEASRVEQGVLCGTVRELQLCMALLMTINRGDVMEASLLAPVEEKSGLSPTPEEEATLLGEGEGPSNAPAPAPQQVKNPRFVEPDK